MTPAGFAAAAPVVSVTERWLVTDRVPVKRPGTEAA